MDDIATQNDDFRKNVAKGALVLTESIRANTPADIEAIISRVRHYNQFDESECKEHDFGTFMFKCKYIFWKIDNYEKDFLYLSRDVSKPRLANKILTVMYAEEC